MAVPHGTRVHPAQPTQRAEHGDPQGDVRVRLHRHEVQHGAAIAQGVPGLQRTGREQTKGKTPLSGRWAAGRTGPLHRIWPRGAGTSPRRSPRTRGHEPEPGPLPRAMLLADEGAPPGAGAAGETAAGSCTAPREPTATFQGCHETTSVAVPNQCSLLGPSRPWAPRQCPQRRLRRPSACVPLRRRLATPRTWAQLHVREVPEGPSEGLRTLLNSILPPGCWVLSHY